MYMLLIEGAGEAQGDGMNPFDPAGFGGMLWTWVIFLAALPFMWKVVMGPIAKALEARDEQASRAIVEAEKAREEASRARTEVESKLAEARAEAAKLVAEARERASVVERQITEEANARTQRMVTEATATIQAERDKALATIREEVVDLSMAGARVVLGRNVGADDDRRLVADRVGKLKAVRK